MLISAAQVKELRERTGAGMMECKKALEVTSGDIERAVEELRKSGRAKVVCPLPPKDVPNKENNA